MTPKLVAAVVAVPGDLFFRASMRAGTANPASGPILPSALDMYERGVTTGVNDVNGERVWAHVRFGQELPAWHREIFVDPQTSGGLLVALPSSVSDQALAALHEAGVTAARRIGRVDEPEGQIRLVFE